MRRFQFYIHDVYVLILTWALTLCLAGGPRALQTIMVWVLPSLLVAVLFVYLVGRRLTSVWSRYAALVLVLGLTQCSVYAGGKTWAKSSFCVFCTETFESELFVCDNAWKLQERFVYAPRQSTNLSSYLFKQGYVRERSRQINGLAGRGYPSSEESKTRETWVTYVSCRGFYLWRSSAYPIELILRHQEALIKWSVAHPEEAQRMWPKIVSAAQESRFDELPAILNDFGNPERHEGQ